MLPLWPSLGGLGALVPLIALLVGWYACFKCLEAEYLSNRALQRHLDERSAGSVLIVLASVFGPATAHLACSPCLPRIGAPLSQEGERGLRLWTLIMHLLFDATMLGLNLLLHSSSDDDDDLEWDFASQSALALAGLSLCVGLPWNLFQFISAAKSEPKPQLELQ